MACLLARVRYSRASMLRTRGRGETAPPMQLSSSSEDVDEEELVWLMALRPPTRARLR